MTIEELEALLAEADKLLHACQQGEVDDDAIIEWRTRLPKPTAGVIDE